ncbi:hypothetical protein BC567DRAFT_221482 [Phyllosticta citribraziliensis]
MVVFASTCLGIYALDTSGLTGPGMVVFASTCLGIYALDTSGLTGPGMVVFALTCLGTYALNGLGLTGAGGFMGVVFASAALDGLGPGGLPRGWAGSEVDT